MLVAVINYSNAGPHVAVLRVASSDGGAAGYQHLESLFVFNPTSLCFSRGWLHVAGHELAAPLGGAAGQRWHSPGARAPGMRVVAHVHVFDSTSWQDVDQIAVTLCDTVPPGWSSVALADVPLVFATERCVLLLLPFPVTPAGAAEATNRIARGAHVCTLPVPMAAGGRLAHAAPYAAHGRASRNATAAPLINLSAPPWDEQFGGQPDGMLCTPECLIGTGAHGMVWQLALVP